MTYKYGIIGDGLIGSALSAYFERRQIVYFQTSRTPKQKQIYFDFNEPKDLPKCELLYFCAGQTSLVECNRNPVASRFLNVEGPQNIIQGLVDTKAVILSTNHVFSGQRLPAKDSAYTAATEYARQKKDIETFALSRGHCVVRMTKVINKHFKIFHNWVDNLRKGKKIAPFVDLYFSPVFIDDALESLVKLEEKCFHISASSDISYAEAAFYLARQLQFPAELINPVSCVEHGVKQVKESALATNIKLSPFRAIDKFLSSL